MLIIFDFDGTIHQTHIIYKKAMEVSLKELGINIDDLDFKSLIGKNPYETWRFLGIKEEKIAHMVNKTGLMMDENMSLFGKLYQGSYQTLSYLKDKYDLMICSNCRNSYMEAARKTYGLDRYFKAYLTGEDYNFIDKYKILKSLYLEEFIVVGDRENDIEAGYKNKMKTIFAAYGYGAIEEAKHASYIINDVRELMKIL